MSKYIATIDNVSGTITRTVIKYRFLVVVLLVAACVGIGTGAKNLTFTPDYRVFFSGENPEMNTFIDFQNTYTKNDNFFFVLKPAKGTVFTRENLMAIQQLTEKAWSIPYANRVDSVTNFQHTYAVGDELIVEDLVLDARSLTDKEIGEKLDIALAEPLLNGQLITANGDAAGVNVTLQLPGETIYEVPTAAAKAREFRSYIEANYPGIDVSITGFGMLNNAFGESGYMDSIKLVPVMYLVLLIAALVALRSLVGTIITLIVAYLSMSVGMGIGGYSGIFLTPVSNSAPIIIITLAIADVVHIFLTFKKNMFSGAEKMDAILAAMKSNYAPVTITSLTTIVGFLSLNLSDSPPFWHLGNLTAIGIAVAWVLSLTLVPAVLSLVPYRTRKVPKTSLGEKAFDAFGNFVVSRAKAIFVVGAAGALIFSLFIPGIKLDDQWSDYFSESIEFRRDTDEATKYFGLYPLEYSIPATGPQGVADPEYLENLERFAKFLRSQENVKHVYSITDILKRLNKNLNGDMDIQYKLPTDRDIASDYLLVYELSLPYGLDLNDRINVNKSASRVTVTLGKVSTLETKAFIDSTQDWIKKNLPSYMQDTRPTSAHVMFTYITDRNVASMLSGTVIAVLAIALVLTFSLGSMSLGLASVASNSLPILSGFGAWALLVGTVGFSVAAVAAIAIGIVVDDTVHMLTKYSAARQEKGLEPREAVIDAFKNVGTAMIVNTFILVAGFIVMASSTFKINSDLGWLSAITIIFALLYDLLVLPAALVLFDKSRKKAAEIEGGNVNIGIAGKALSILIIAGLATLITYPEAASAAEDTKARGFAVSARSDRSDRGFQDSRSKVKMVLRNAKGEEAIRVLDVLTLEVPSEDSGDKSIVIFEEPSDISGTALLSHAKILDPDDQWLYLNSMKRVKRISSRNKSGPFMGSEFAFEDFTSQELKKYDHEWLREEEFNGLKCDVIQRTPKYEYSGYSRLLVWIDTNDFQIRKVEFYDRKQALLKTLTLEEYVNHNGVWRSHKWTMINHQTKKSTELTFTDYQFKIGMQEQDFVKQRLTRLN